MRHLGPSDDGEHKTGFFLAAEQHLSIGLVTARTERMPMTARRRLISPDALQRSGVGEPRRSVRGKQLVDHRRDGLDDPARFRPHLDALPIWSIVSAGDRVIDLAGDVGGNELGSVELDGCLGDGELKGGRIGLLLVPGIGDGLRVRLWQSHSRGRRDPSRGAGR